MALSTIGRAASSPRALDPDETEEIPAGVPRHGGNGQPWIRHPGIAYDPELDDGDAKSRRGRGAYHSRASSWGEALANHYLINRWQLRGVVFGMSRDESLVMAAQAVADMDEREELQRIEQLARVGAKQDEAARKGTAFHILAQRRDAGEDLSYLPARILEALDAWTEITAPLGRIISTEQLVVWDEYQVTGSYDRLYELLRDIQIRQGGVLLDTLRAGERIIADLKSGSTARYFDCRYGMQVLPYANGVPYSHQLGRLEWPDGIAPSTRWAVIPHVSHEDGGASAELIWVDLHHFHSLIPDLQRVQEIQRTAKSGFISHEYEPAAESLPMPPLAVTVAAGVPRQVVKVGIIAALNDAKDKAAMLAVWSEFRHVWDEDCERMATAKAAQFDLQGTS